MYEMRVFHGFVPLTRLQNTPFQNRREELNKLTVLRWHFYPVEPIPVEKKFDCL